MTSPTVPSSKSPPIHALTSLRFFAALLVVFFHYGGIINYPGILGTLLGQGSAGVNFFFVLSGFVLTYNYFAWFKNGTSRFGAFARARFARIYPMHLVTLIVMTAVEVYFLYQPMLVPQRELNSDIGVAAATMQHEFNPHIDSGSMSISWFMNLFLLQAYIPSYPIQQLWNPPAWSISAEAFFYIGFPFFICYVLSRFKRVRSVLLLACSLFAIQTAAFIGMVGLVYLNRASIESNLEFNYMMLWAVAHPPFLRIWEFFLGCTVGVLFLQLWEGQSPAVAMRMAQDPRWRNAGVAIALMGILGVALLLPPYGFLGYLKMYLSYTPFFALLIVTLALGRTFLTGILEHPWLVLLGEASYSLYLVHWIPYTILQRNAHPDQSIPTWLAIVAIAATVAASLGCYKYIEVPARRALREGPSLGLLARPFVSVRTSWERWQSREDRQAGVVCRADGYPSGGPGEGHRQAVEAASPPTQSGV